MADFAPPTGPPPPKVPQGWKAVWNDQYSEWFFVNIYTKKSQWDKPTEPIYPPNEEAPHGPPPTYGTPGIGPVGGQMTGASEKSNLSSNNPYAAGAVGTNMSEDEKLARKLQEEEDARVGQHSGDHRGAASDFYNQPGQSQYGGQPLQSASPYPQAQPAYQDVTTQDKGKSSKGLLGKLLGKASGHSSSSAHPPVQHGYGQPGYGAAPGGYYGGGYQQQPMGYGAPGRRPGGGGMGTGGALALGAGGGLLGGALIGSALADGGDHGNYGDGGDYGGDGGDFGGGDMGGGDFGGGDF